MRIKELTLIHFRNYTSLDVCLHPGINLLMGENAQGKTNLLEALYYCAALRSFRTRRDSDLIQFGENYGYLKVNLISQPDEQAAVEQEIEMVFQPDQKKRIKRNGLSQVRISEVMGTFKAVLFSPEDLKIVKDSPSERRQFMDSEMSQVSPRYYHTLLSFQKTLRQRNQLLKKKEVTAEELGVWDNQLAEYGSLLMWQRKGFLEEIEKKAIPIHRRLTKGKEELALKYETGFFLPKRETWENRENLKLEMIRTLTEQRKQDLFRQSTGKGPHRDDVFFSINHMDVRQYGSQGQKRTVVLSLKLAVLEWMKEKAGEYPVLLLDDVTSELDENRQRDLLEFLKPVQTIITATHPLPGMNIGGDTGMTFSVQQGRIPGSSFQKSVKRV